MDEFGKNDSTEVAAIPNIQRDPVEGVAAIPQKVRDRENSTAIISAG